MEWSRRLRILWRVPMVAIIATAMFWAVWYAIAESFPLGIFGIPRWLDILYIGPFAVILTAMFTSPKFSDNNLSAGLSVGLFHGLLAGLILGLIAGFGIGIFEGLLLGIGLGIFACLFAIFLYGWLTLCRLLSSKKLWLAIGRGFKAFGRWVIAK